ncbi:MAG: HD domain-containing protein [Patescibacteria group bacterium]
MSREKNQLQRILTFSDLMNKFQKINRVILEKDRERYENDVEHSYMLAMLADYIIVIENLKLDRRAVMMYSMMHDLVEIYAGDTYIGSRDTEYIASKHSREADALVRIISEFPEYPDLQIYIEKYEKKVDEESKFVYALDKLQPVIQIYLDSGRTWRKEGMSFADLCFHKDEKVKVSPVVEKYWNELRGILEKSQTELFPS